MLECNEDIFKSPCTNEIGKEDIQLGAEIVNGSLQRYQKSKHFALYTLTSTGTLERLWGTIDKTSSPVDAANRREEIQVLCDGIATGAYVKV